MKSADLPSTEPRRTYPESEQVALLRKILRLKIPLGQFRRAVELVIDGR